MGYMLGIQQISIHAPLTGSDYLAIFYVFQNKYFNPRSPHRERRVRVVAIIKCRNFNPRSPHRERRHIVRYNSGVKIFQSTLPSQGATLFRAVDTRPPQISIHAPLTGSDLYRMRQGRYGILISIHAPLTGSDTVLGYDGDILVKFQSTLPSQGATTIATLCT